MDEEGNMGYYLYNEATGEEKLFSVVEEEREFGVNDLKLAKKLYPGYAKYVSGSKEADALLKRYLRFYRASDIGSNLGAEHSNIKELLKLSKPERAHSIHGKISSIDRRVRKKAGKAIDVGGFENLI